MPMDISFDAFAKLLAPLLAALIIGIIKRYTAARPKLVTYLVHATAIPVPAGQAGSPSHVNMHTVVIANTGKKTARNVRMGHFFLPPGHQIWPPVSHQIATGVNGSAEILFPTLVPGEQVSLSYLYFPPVTWDGINSYAKSDEGNATVIKVFPAPQPNRAVQVGLWTLVFVGTATILYGVILAAVAWVR